MLDFSFLIEIFFLGHVLFLAELRKNQILQNSCMIKWLYETELQEIHLYSMVRNRQCLLDIPPGKNVVISCIYFYLAVYEKMKNVAPLINWPQLISGKASQTWKFNRYYIHINYLYKLQQFLKRSYLNIGSRVVPMMCSFFESFGHLWRHSMSSTSVSASSIASVLWGLTIYEVYPLHKTDSLDSIWKEMHSIPI